MVRQHTVPIAKLADYTVHDLHDLPSIIHEYIIYLFSKNTWPLRSCKYKHYSTLLNTSVKYIVRIPSP